MREGGGPPPPWVCPDSVLPDAQDGAADFPGEVFREVVAGGPFGGVVIALGGGFQVGGKETVAKDGGSAVGRLKRGFRFQGQTEEAAPSGIARLGDQGFAPESGQHHAEPGVGGVGRIDFQLPMAGQLAGQIRAQEQLHLREGGAVEDRFDTDRVVGENGFASSPLIMLASGESQGDDEDKEQPRGQARSRFG